MSVEKSTNPANIPDAVVDREDKGIQVVWLLPVIALLIGGWLIFKTMSESGPDIEISFNTAAGIEKGKTRIKYRDVTVGTVSTVEFSDDLTRVIVSAEMAAGTGRHLTDETRFWVVRPRIGARGISGLGTLISGAYIAMEPGMTGDKQRSFTGLENPPAVSAEEKGTEFTLTSKDLGSLTIGAPIYFRQFDVGEVTGYKLSGDHSHVEIGIFIEAPHDEFVQTGTRFWNAGGVNLSMSSSGIDVEMQSLVSLISGGIAFETLPENSGTPLATQGNVFTLHKNHTASLEQQVTKVFTYAAKFGRTVRGLDVGAPVEFRGIRVGTVTDIELGSDSYQEGVLVPVVIFDIEPERTAGYRDVGHPSHPIRTQKEFEENPDKRIDDLVKLGLRARLQTGNLVTGKLFVELDMFPGAKPAEIISGGLYPEMPTAPNPLEDILAGISRIVKNIDKAEIGATVAQLNKLLETSDRLVQTLDKNAPKLATELATTLESLRNMTTTDGEIGNEIYNALTELTAAARSIRIMSEYLERHPEALISGKGNKP